MPHTDTRIRRVRTMLAGSQLETQSSELLSLELADSFSRPGGVVVRLVATVAFLISIASSKPTLGTLV